MVIASLPFLCTLARVIWTAGALQRLQQAIACFVLTFNISQAWSNWNLRAAESTVESQIAQHFDFHETSARLFLKLEDTFMT